MYAPIRNIMKKTLTAICIFALVALMCAMLVACNPKDMSDPDDNDSSQNTYEQAKYTVTFNTNSNFTFEGSVLKDVVAGSKIKAPTNDKGEKIVPIKAGYTFQFWSSDGTTEFDFNTQTINKNTTLIAQYTPNRFVHNVVLDATYTYKADGTIEINEGKYNETTGYTASLGADTKLVSIYASAENLACPTAVRGDDNSENDVFYFWFYIDKDGKPVRFTKIAGAKDSTVASLEKYSVTTSSSDVLTLYPMFRSTLPKVTVEYYDKDGNIVSNETKSYPICDAIAEESAYTPQNLSEYKFNNWYYNLTDADGNTQSYDMLFKNSSVDGTALINTVDDGNYFSNATLKLYSNWTKQISISSKSQYDNIYNALHNADLTNESNKKNAEEILTADITFVGTIDLGQTKYEPLFDGEHVFRGTIEGGTFDDGNKVSQKAVIKGGVFGSASHASIFGYVNGKIANLVLENNTFEAVSTDGVYDSIISVGVLATENKGVINGIEVRGQRFNFTEEGLNTLIIGGIVATNSGTASAGTDDGYISDCVVGESDNVLQISVDCKSLVFGGIVGRNDPSSTIVGCKAYSMVQNATLTDAKIGGVAGRNSGQIDNVSVSFKVVNLSASNECNLGGAVGVNMSAVKRVAVTLSVGAENAITVGGSLSQIVNIGGIVGKHAGYLQNSYVNITDAIKVKLTTSSAVVAVGGIVGNNNSGTTQTSATSTSDGAVYYCYSTGNISVDASAVTNAQLYVAGIIGRNFKKAVNSCFTTADISIANEGESANANKLHLGYGFGAMENESLVTRCYYLEANKLALNGENYSVSYIDGKEESNFEITTTAGLQKPTDANAFTIASWYNDGNVEFDSKVWNIENGSLPTLK